MNLLDPDAIYFPTPRPSHRLRYFRPADVRSRHLRGRFRSLQSTITNDPSLGERRANQWNARRRSDCMAKLIKNSFPMISKGRADHEGPD